MPDAPEHERRYLVLVRFDESVPAQDRLQRAQAILAAIRLAAGAEPHMLFNSADAGTFGVLAKVRRPAAVLRAGFDRHVRPNDRGFIMVLELGAEFDAIGNSAGWRWLQH